MRCHNYILNEHDEPIVCEDLMQWASWFETADRHIAKTKISGPNVDIKISTVFLGLNHNYGDGPPLLYETMVFGGRLDQEMARYSTREEALQGHEAMCERVEEAL